MRHICSRKIYILMMRQSRKEIEHRMSFTYIYIYMHMIPILRFLQHLYGDFSLKLYIFSFIYCVYIQTHSAVALITNIFIKQSTVLGGEEVKI